MKQVQAVLGFDGSATYQHVDQRECTFVHGAQDLVFDHRHHSDLKRLCPLASHHVIEGLGHMINIERPQIFLDFTQA
jgi:pimeloyl-ACP methyl ester carboxylesterase